MVHILLCRTTLFLRGAGGFSKTSRPFSYTNYPTNQVPVVRIPKTQPFVIFEDPTQPSQVCINVFADVSDFVSLSSSNEFSLSASSWLASPVFEKAA